MTTGDPAGTPQTEWSLPRPGMHFILFGYFCIAVKIPSPPPCGVKTIRWKPSELGCHRPSPSSQSWTSMSMPITMGGSSSALCHQSGRRPWSARTGRAWLLGVSEESAPRPLEAFPGVQRKYGSDLSSGQSRVSQHLTGVGHPGTDRGWRATDIGHASRKRSSRAPS